ncbi:hepatocyte cell adhesion molecule-like isoform X1 [Xiphophorus couchianus]|uniref:hepatocyte cell adhesion molecule-like isoform X1 n=1 Tax=Xiphophorus couchianus TaxID=32473 RepID=UPI001015D9E0|nr:hepatocyte cell adhesion molecule-like isoform X1 [Xiphophorus couchianus]
MAAGLGVTCCSVYLTAGKISDTYLTVLLCYVCAKEEKKAVKARARTNITLQPVESPHNARVVWTFGVESPNIRIASVKLNKEVKCDYEEKFRDRLLLDSNTGALTISQLEMSDSGVYQFQSISSKILSRDFHLTVYSFLPMPSITVTSSVINTSSASVTVECSVQNSRELKLSWYRGTERLKQTNSPSLPSELSLSLEVDAADGDNYSCMAENPVERQTTKLLTKDIQLGNGENSSWCQNEATVRLIVSAGIALVLILLLVDHIRF